MLSEWKPGTRFTIIKDSGTKRRIGHSILNIGNSIGDWLHLITEEVNSIGDWLPLITEEILGSNTNQNLVLSVHSYSNSNRLLALVLVYCYSKTDIVERKASWLQRKLHMRAHFEAHKKSHWGFNSCKFCGEKHEYRRKEIAS